MNPSPARVLVVEDERDLREVLVYQLKRAGFDTRETANGFEAWEMMRRDPPSLVLLDLQIEGLSGLSFCRQLRRHPETAGTPVIMVTAAAAEDEVLAGMEAGADDYVRKPFKVREVVARVKTLLRRAEPVSPESVREVLTAGVLTLDAARHEVRLAGTPLVLTSTEFRLLHHFMKHPGLVFSRRQLGEVAGEQRVSATGRNIDVHIRALRKKLGREAGLIGTARGFGYRLEHVASPAAACHAQA